MINKMIDLELEQIVKNHGTFKNPQEFAGCMIEELEEANEAMTPIVMTYYEKVWKSIRGNEDININDLQDMIDYCKNTIIELVQIAAVAKKCMKGFSENE